MNFIEKIASLEVELKKFSSTDNFQMSVDEFCSLSRFLLESDVETRFVTALVEVVAKNPKIVNMDDVLENSNMILRALFDEHFEGKMFTTAQRRSLTQWLGEKVNIPRHLAETFNSEVYGKQMNLLREVDDVVRDIAKKMRSDLKDMKRAMKQRKYLDVAHFVGNINDKLKEFNNELSVLNNNRSDNIDDFYGEYEYADLDRDYFGEAKAAKTPEQILKEAGIWDSLSRSQAAKLLEKMYNKTLAERKRDMQKLVNNTEKMVEHTLGKLKDMGSYRSKGDISKYIAALEDIEKKRLAFESQFRNTYQQHISPMVERMRERKQEQKDLESVREQDEKTKDEIPSLDPDTVDQETVEMETRVNDPDTEPGVAPTEPGTDREPLRDLVDEDEEIELTQISPKYEPEPATTPASLPPSSREEPNNDVSFSRRNIVPPAPDSPVIHEAPAEGTYGYYAERQTDVPTSSKLADPNYQLNENDFYGYWKQYGEPPRVPKSRMPQVRELRLIPDYWPNPAPNAGFEGRELEASFINEIIKQSKDAGHDDVAISATFKTLSKKLNETGNETASLQALAIAEGFEDA